MENAVVKKANKQDSDNVATPNRDVLGVWLVGWLVG